MAIAHDTKPRSNLTEEPQANAITCGSFAFEDGLRFRPITVADLDDIMVIERNSFPVPWSVNFFRQELQVACARSVLAESDGKIIGYVLFWLLPGAIDVHNIAVHVGYRRRGIARMLLSRVVGEARRRAIYRVLLEVRRSNFPAQKLYEALGFKTTGIRKGYYSDNGEDALAMTLELNSVS
ncbi:MAG: ribosomal protein S18-alanine N-acetyltransferase [Chloroflexota bacterium]|jgi:ribosomal-protein-alanine N-acetyltransferase